MARLTARKIKMGSMSTSNSSDPLNAALSNIPKKFRDKIQQHYIATKTALAEGRNEAVGLAAGKLCEAVLRFLQHEIHGTYTAFNRSIGNFADECRKLIISPNTSVQESLRVVMPRALVFGYTIRNKRGIGHIGGDVDANIIDAMTLARSMDWIICELVRVYHGLSLEEAQDLVDSLSTRNLPDVWVVAGKKRVLRSDLSFKQKVLMLCYQESTSAVMSEDLFDWVEYSNFSVFKSKVLRPLHKERLVEYDSETDSVTISPLGIKAVEETVLKKIAV